MYLVFVSPLKATSDHPSTRNIKSIWFLLHRLRQLLTICHLLNQLIIQHGQAFIFISVKISATIQSFASTSTSCDISMYSYISILSFTHSSPLIFFSICCTTHNTKEIQIPSTAVPHMSCVLITLNLLAKTTTKMFLVGIFQFFFLNNFELVLGFFVFPRGNF